MSVGGTIAFSRRHASQHTWKRLIAAVPAVLQEKEGLTHHLLEIGSEVASFTGFFSIADRVACIQKEVF